MRYRKLERLLLSVGLLGVLVSMVVAVINGAPLFNFLGQLLFVPAFFFTLHYGRRYGYIATALSALVLLVVRTLTDGAIDLSTPEGREALVLISAFGVAGIIGGELAARIKYATASLADEGFIDPDTGIFSAAYIDRVINKCWSTYRRDKKPFSVLFIDVVWPDSIKTAAKEKLQARIANVIRTNVRLVDDVGCIEADASASCFHTRRSTAR